MSLTNNFPNVSYIQEKTAYELKPGDRIIRPKDNEIFKIEKVCDAGGISGRPNIFMSGSSGFMEHDTRFDSPDEKYMCYVY